MTEPSSLSHDQNFKNLILDYPRPALEFFAAEEATDLTQARIVPIRQEQRLRPGAHTSGSASAQ